MRDLAADLKICEAATPGPWEAVGQGGVSMDDGDRDYYEIQKQRSNVVIDSWGGRLIAKIFLSRRKNRREDAEFIAAARERWPEAIRRAIAAEAEVELLREELERERYKAEAFFAGLKDAQECKQAMFALVDQWHNEVERLGQRLVEWQQVENAIMQAVTGKPRSLSDSDVIAEVERLRKLEAVAEAAKSIVLPECKRCSSYGPCTKDEEDCGIYKLKCALAATEGGQVDG